MIICTDDALHCGRPWWLMVLLLTIFGFVAATVGRAAEGNGGACGDQCDGTYLNPILPGDFSDPDVIRVEIGTA